MFPRVASASASPNFRLQLVFTNGEHREFSVEPYLQYQVYKPLQEMQFFVKVSAQNGTVCWGEDSAIDFDPDTLYIESVATK